MPYLRSLRDAGFGNCFEAVVLPNREIWSEVTEAFLIRNVKERDLEELLVEMISWLMDGGLVR
jgi:hypothetical protein